MANVNENVRVNFVTAFDGKGLNAAKGQIGALEQLASRAAKTFASLFAAQKIAQFGKASVQAFAQDQKSAAILAKTLDNLGLAFADVRVADFIQKLEKTSGVLDDNLRPAFARFIRQTGDVTKSQELLKLALDVSAGTGQDLMTVSNALAKAYGGQYTSLSKLGAGLTKADLATNNFVLIQSKLNKLFAGQSGIAADSYQGKLDRINVAIDNMKESIGQGLIDAFTKFSSKDGSLNKATEAVAKFGETIGNAVTGLGVLIGKLNTPVDDTGLVSFFKKSAKYLGFTPNPADLPIVRILAKIGKDSKNLAPVIDLGAAFKNAQLQKVAAANAAAANAKAKADQAALVKAEKDKLALQKAQLALKLDSKVLDLQQIELFAAMQEAKGTDLDRLKLQQAILDNNASSAKSLADKVLAANGLVMDLQGNITADPFAAWNDSLNKMLDTAIKAKKELDAIKVSIQPPSGGGGAAPSGGMTSDSTFPGGVYLGGEKIPVPSSSLPALTNSIYVGGQKIDLNISLDNGLIVKQNQDASSNGVQTTLSRNNPGYF